MNVEKSEKIFVVSSASAMGIALIVLLVFSGGASTTQIATSGGMNLHSISGEGAIHHLPAGQLSPLASSAGPSTITAFLSFNWGGYADNATANSVTVVSGTWTVPTISASATCSIDDWFSSSTWVGIDGLTSNTVEQTGTASQCYEGTLQYFAWYEFYPLASVVITSVPISPGNVVTASVTYSTSTLKFTTKLTDTSTGKSFTSPATAVSGASRNSAEWITESPSSTIGVLPLADFVTATFSKGSATVSGKTTAIGGYSATWSLTIADFPAYSPDKATVSSISSGAFTVTWKSLGPYP